MVVELGARLLECLDKLRYLLESVSGYCEIPGGYVSVLVGVGVVMLVMLLLSLLLTIAIALTFTLPLITTLYIPLLAVLAQCRLPNDEKSAPLKQHHLSSVCGTSEVRQCTAHLARRRQQLGNYLRPRLVQRLIPYASHVAFRVYARCTSSCVEEWLKGVKNFSLASAIH